MFKPLVGGVAAATLAITGLGVVAGAADATQHHDATHVVVTPPENLLDTSQSRSTGHNDFLENGLHVWTEGNQSTDKAAGYLAQTGSLADLAAAGEPNIDWTPTSPDLPQAPGMQIVVDFDGDGVPDGILVGEPAYYGNEWWLSNDSQQWVKDEAPNTGSGYGSPYYGTLKEWAQDANFPNATVAKVGYSMGSGVHGDGVISSMTFGDVTYTFALGFGPCQAVDDFTTDTYTLSQPCSTYETINVPDGWTVDGAGNTITAVQDADHPTFTGAVIQSATGDATGPASMNVQNLSITTQGFDQFGQNSGGTLAGIRYDRAGGNVSNVTINGISHGNGVQEGNALYVRNRDASGSYDVPHANITVSNLDVSNYQKTGVIFDGNLDFTMTNSTVGSAGAPDGSPIPNIGANSVQVSRDAQGSITDSKIGLNDYNPDSPPGDGSDATGILVYSAKTVTLQRDVIAGTNGDVGLDAYNDTDYVLNTHVIVSCSLFSRSETAGDYDPYGVGIAQWNDGSTPVEIDLSDSTFSGWKYDTGSLTGTPPNLQVDTGATDQHLGQCPPSAPTNVSVPGGDQQTDVTWTASTAPAYAPLEGYTVTAKDANGNVVSTQNVGPGTLTAHLAGLTSGQDYTISVTAYSEGGTSQADTATLYATSTTLNAVDDTVTWGGVGTTLNGTLDSNDPNAVLAGRTVDIQSAPAGSDDWTDLTNSTVDANGEFSTDVTPSANTDYRAVYAGDPDNSSVSATTTVDVALKVKLKAGHKHGRIGGKKIAFSGVVSPNQSGNLVHLWYQRGKHGTWTEAIAKPLDEQSSYFIKWLPSQGGTYRFQVRADADATHVDGTSNTVKVVIGP